ncbi:MAG: hypothetical protein AAGB31_03070 [Bdellovibrio sp.]
MSAVQCQLEIPAKEGLTERELTVGREFILVCQGDFPAGVQAENFRLQLKPEEKYNLHLLSFEFRSPTQADVKVTAYRAGTFSFPDLQLTDGQQVLSLGPVQYKVESVLPPPQEGQTAPPEPYGPIGPASLAVPILYWALLAGVVGAFALWLIARIYRTVQRRNMVVSLREHDSALSPLAQYHQNLRRMQRSNSVFFGGKAEPDHVVQCLQESHRMLKLYLTRRYQIPALKWSDRVILKDLKIYQSAVFKEYGVELKKLLNEYARGFRDQNSLQEQDVLNITQRTRLLVEKMERLS